MTENRSFYVLIAPEGQLCGNGQLRETISERRKKSGNEVPFWYLSPALAKTFQITDLNFEAVVAEDKTAINWLQLRFGGEISQIHLNIEKLKKEAMELPPSAKFRDISSSDHI